MNRETTMTAEGAGHDDPPHLVRAIGLKTAINLNVLNMVGVGPFITLPLMVAALGRLAIVGWICGALLALCDGMIWAELGTRFPESGGSYLYLNQLYGPQRWGRLLSFLFIWQLLFSAPLSTASGAVGLANYASYVAPGLSAPIYRMHLGMHTMQLTGATLVAMAACGLATALIYTGIQTVGRISRVLSVGVVLALLWVIASGLFQFHHVAIGTATGGSIGTAGFGTGLLIAMYNYGGYYNICFLAGEVRDPRRVIPRAVVLSIVIVALLYVFLNVSVLRVIPAAQFAHDTGALHASVVAVLMQRLYGRWAGLLMALLIVWTAFASVFSVLLGYSRVPFAAARDNNFFRPFGRLHPEKHFPTVSLVVLGALAVFFCIFRLTSLIAALVVTRIVFQFLLQAFGLLLFRKRLGESATTFRMPLYPIPVLITIAGFFFVLTRAEDLGRKLLFAGFLLLSGLVLYAVRAMVARRAITP